MANQLAAIKAKLGGLGIFKQLATIFYGPTDVLAVDVGTYAIKAAYINEEGGKPDLKAWGYLPLELKADATPEERKAQAINVMRAFLIEKGIKTKAIATAISGNSVIVRYVKFPMLTKAELSATLATEAEPFIPFDINEVQLSFHILDDTLMEEGQKKMETVLVAAKKDLVTSRIDLIQSIGLTPAILDVDSFTLENVHSYAMEGRPETKATLYLNVGHMVTNLSILEGGKTRVVRDVFVSGNSFTKAIMKALQLDYPKAEEAKKAHGLIVDNAEKEKALAANNREALGVSQAIAGVVKDLVSEVHRSVDFYLSQGPERDITRIMLSGGSASIKNLAKHLAAELKVPVSVLDPFSYMKNPPAIPAELKPSFGVAAGLALRRNRDWA